MLICLNKQRPKSPVFGVSLRESNVNSSPKGVEEISIFTDFPQSDSIEIFTKCLKIHIDQSECKNLDYLLI
jgi:hypothetical protein